jgi:hypothetical protein
MKIYKLLLLIPLLICSGIVNGYAERLYTYIDEKGVTHISQDAPSQDGVLIDIIDYRSQPKEQNQKAESKQAQQHKSEPKQTIVVTGEVSEPDDHAIYKTCILHAATSQVNVTVWDYDSVGNRQGVIYRGRLGKGEHQKIKSYTGYIIFSYQLYDDDKSFGDNRSTCENGNTIQVP